MLNSRPLRFPHAQGHLIALICVALAASACGESGSEATDGRITTMQVTVSGFVFDARAAGPRGGEPVLLLHGFPQSSYEWRAQLEALGTAGYRAIAPDLRGYSPGARPSDVAAYGMHHLIEDTLALADQLGFRTFHLIGHDWGAAIAWEVAITYPQRLRSLTAVSVPHPAAFAAALATDPDQQQRSSYIQFFRQTGVAERALLANDARLLRSIYGSGPAAMAADEYVRLLSQPRALTAALNYYRANDLGDLNLAPVVGVPTLYVWSTEDVALGRIGAEATVNYVDAPYRFAVLEGVSHWVPEDAAADLTGLLLDHLRSPP